MGKYTSIDIDYRRFDEAGITISDTEGGYLEISNEDRKFIHINLRRKSDGKKIMT